MGLSPFSDAAPEVLRVSLAQTSSGRLRAELVLQAASGGRRGERTLEAHDCAALHAATVFAAAMVLEPLGRAQPAPPIAPSPVPPSSATGAPVMEPTLPPGGEWEGRLGVKGMGTGWVLTAPALGAAAVAELGRGPWSLGMELGALSSINTSSLRGTFRTSLVRAGLWPCLRRSRVGACLGGELGRLRLSGEPREPSRSEALWGAVGAKVRLDVPLSGTVLGHGSLGPTCALLRSRILVGSETLWEMPTCGAEFGLGVVWQP